MTPAVAYACNLYLGLWVRDPGISVSIVRQTPVPEGCEMQLVMGRGTKTIMTRIWLSARFWDDSEEMALRIGHGLECLADAWRQRSARLYDKWKIEAPV